MKTSETVILCLSVLKVVEQIVRQEKAWFLVYEFRDENQVFSFLLLSGA
jgi:hypothetical protein